MQAKKTLWGLVPDGRCEAQLQRFRRTANAHIAESSGKNSLTSSVPVMLQLGRVHCFGPAAPQLRRIGLPKLRPDALQITEGCAALLLPEQPIQSIQDQLAQLTDGFVINEFPKLIFGTWMAGCDQDGIASLQGMWPQLQNRLGLLGGFQLCCGTLTQNQHDAQTGYSWQLHYAAPLRKPRISTDTDM